MKYFIYAKILGTFLPDKVLHIENCKIEKGYWLLDVPVDRPELPPRMKSSEHHSLAKGVGNFVVFPQKQKPIRTFESNYYISTIVDGYNLYDVIEKAENRFLNVVTALSLSIKNTVRKLGNRRVRRDQEFYDFEIAAVFIKRKKEFIQVKLPEPLGAVHNYFPQNFPKGFVICAKKYLTYSSRNMVFKQAMGYMKRCYRMNNSGNVSEMELIINFLKSIELVCNFTGIGKVKDKKTGKMRRPYTKELFALAGKKLKVQNKFIKYSQEAWGVRSDGDIAHYNKGSGGFNFLNFGLLDAAACDYLIKFYKSGLGFSATPYILNPYTI